MSIFTVPVEIDWEVEIAADEAALKTKLNALRDAKTGVQDIIFHPGVGFAVMYLRPTYNFAVSSNIVSSITDPSISV